MPQIATSAPKLYDHLSDIQRAPGIDPPVAISLSFEPINDGGGDFSGQALRLDRANGVSGEQVINDRLCSTHSHLDTLNANGDRLSRRI